MNAYLRYLSSIEENEVSTLKESAIRKISCPNPNFLRFVCAFKLMCPNYIQPQFYLYL